MLCAYAYTDVIIDWSGLFSKQDRNNVRILFFLSVSVNSLTPTSLESHIADKKLRVVLFGVHSILRESHLSYFCSISIM